MKCFKHREAEAVGICMNCGKAVCIDCARDRRGRLVCFRCANRVDYEGFQSERLVSKELLKEYRKWEEVHGEEAYGRSGGGEKRLGLGEMAGGLSRLMKLIFPHDSALPVMKEHGADMIMPMLVGGFVAGFLASLPVINLLFFITIPLGAAISIAFLRMEGYFQYRISDDEGMKVGLFAGIVAAFVSVFLAVTYATFFGDGSFAMIKGLYPDLSNFEADALLKTLGLDRHLSIGGVLERLAGNLVLYGFFGAAGGLFFAEKMR